MAALLPLSLLCWQRAKAASRLSLSGACTCSTRAAAKRLAQPRTLPPAPAMAMSDGSDRLRISVTQKLSGPNTPLSLNFCMSAFSTPVSPAPVAGSGRSSGGRGPLSAPPRSAEGERAGPAEALARHTQLEYTLRMEPPARAAQRHANQDPSLEQRAQRVLMRTREEHVEQVFKLLPQRLLLAVVGRRLAALARLLVRQRLGAFKDLLLRGQYRYGVQVCEVWRGWGLRPRDGRGATGEGLAVEAREGRRGAERGSRRQNRLLQSSRGQRDAAAPCAARALQPVVVCRTTERAGTSAAHHLLGDDALKLGV